MANQYASTVLKKGKTGEAVGYLQQQLVDNFSAKITVDRDFGTKTKTAVQKFQKDHELKADGIVGKNTWAKIDSESTTSAPPPPADAPPADECVLEVRVVCRNSRGRGMMNVQGAEVRFGNVKKRTATNGDATMNVKAGTYTPQVTKRGFELEEACAKLRVRARAGGTIQLHLEMVRADR